MIRFRRCFFFALLTGNVCLSASYGDGVFSCSAERAGEMYFNQVEFGQRIKEQRTKMGLTQEELAFRLNIGHEHMNKIERGKRGCSIDIILELSEVFGVSTDYLLTGKKADDESIRDSVENIMDELSSILARIDGKLA